MANKHMKRRLTSRTMREMQIKTTMKYHLTRISLAAVNREQKITSIGESVENQDPWKPLGR